MSRETEELLTRYVLMLRFILRDRVKRSFRAEGRHERGNRDVWLKLGRSGDVAEMARAYVPNLGGYTFHGFYSAIVAEPWPDVIKKRAAKLGRKRLTSIHRLTISLREIRPPIWRRIEVPSDITLGELHDVVQDTMGWDDYHLHEFQVGDTRYGDPLQLQELFDQDEWKARLAQVAPVPESRIGYHYDFGDSWHHDIVVEAVEPPRPGVQYPVCIAGQRASPREDSGGPWRFDYLTKLMADSENADAEDLVELEEFLEWWGRPFDPEAFDPAEVNRRLARLR